MPQAPDLAPLEQVAQPPAHILLEIFSTSRGIVLYDPQSNKHYVRLTSSNLWFVVP